MIRTKFVGDTKGKLLGLKDQLRNGRFTAYEGKTCDEWTQYLLGGFIVDWSFVLSHNELEEFYFPLLFGDPGGGITSLTTSKTVLQYLLSSFPPSTEKQSDEESLRQERLGQLLVLWIRKDRLQILTFFEDILFDKIKSLDSVRVVLEQNKETIMCLLSLPTKAANIFRHQTPDELLPNQYLETILFQSLQFIQKYKSSECLTFYCGAIFHILGKYISLYPRESAMLGEYIANWWTCLPSTRGALAFIDTRSLSPFLFASLSSLPSKIIGVQRQHTEPLTRNESPSFIFACIIDSSVESTRMIANILCDQFISNKMLPRASLLTLVHALYFLDENKPSEKINILKVLRNAADAWSNKIFLQRATEELHEYISRTLVYICQLYYNQPQRLTETREFNEITGILLKGIQLHIASPKQAIRTWGMIVAERFARYFGGESKLEFEYDPIIDEETEDENSDKEKELKVPSPIDGVGKNTKERENENSSKIIGFHVPEDEIDPDELVTFSSDEDEDEEDSEDLSEYDLDDEMDDLQTVAAPVYLADCIRLLRDTENPDSTEAALGVVEQIIKRKPDDLDERAFELTRCLLFMSSSIHTEEYQTCRIRSLVALATNSTQQVVPYLTEQFYADNHNIQARLDILKVLTESSKEISGNTIESNQTETIQEQKQPKPENPFEIISGMTSSTGFREQNIGAMTKVRSHPSHNLSERIQSHTRKWSSLERRKAAQLVAKANRFDNVCGDFFFPLIKDYDNPKNRFNLLGEDSLVLAQLLFTLGVFLECSSCKTPIGERMIATSLELCWAIRLHPEAFVRRSIFFTVGRAFMRSSKQQILTELESAAVAWKEFLEDIADIEADEQARELSFVALFCMKHSLEQ